MAKKIYEVDAKNQFLQHKEDERAEKWEVSDEDVVTDPRTRTDFDYQLAFGPKRIALEIMRFVPDVRGLAESIAHSEILSALGLELRKRRVIDVTIWISFLNVSKPRRKQYVQHVADELDAVARPYTLRTSVRIDGRTYTLVPSPGVGDVFFVRAFGGGGGDPREQLPQLVSVFRKKLPHKNRQLSVADHERILLIVSLDEMTRTEDVREALSYIDLSILPNIEKVYFKSGSERIDLVYERC
jgi:hypothetical protein